MKEVFLLFALALGLDVVAQKPESPLGRIWQQSLPFITNYSTDEYKAAFQNWALVQGNNGVMYAANNSGVLEYDGMSWQLIQTTEGNPVRSLAKDLKGRIYVGGSGEVGYLAANGQNKMVFHSLKNKINRADWNFGNVWFTFADKSAVYFVCDLHILELVNGKFKVWKSDVGTLGFAWLINGTLYVSTGEKGLLKKEKDALKLVAGGEAFKGMGLTGLLPYEGDKLLAVGLSKEFFIYDGSKLEPFMKDGQRVRIRDAVYHGLRLSNGDYALATTGSGLYLMARNGTIRNNICRKEGLSSDAVYSVFEDAEKDLWLATDNGISRLEINSPLRVLNENHGLDENPMDIEVFNNKLFTTNSKGLFELNSLPSQGVYKPYFKKIEGIDNLTMHCHTYGDELLVSNYDGVFVLDQNGRRSQIAKENVVRVEESRPAEMPRHLLAGLEGNGLTELLFVDGKWVQGGRRDDMKFYSESFARAADGTIFINSRRNGIYEIAWQTPGPAHTLRHEFKLIHHGPENGLSSNKIRWLERVGNTVYASTDEAMHRFNPVKRVFEVDTLLTAGVASYKGGWINEIIAGRDGTMWFTLYHNYQSHFFEYRNNRLQRLSMSGRLSDALISKVHDNGDGFMFFGSNKWIVLFDKNLKTGAVKPFKTLIRRIAINKDSLISFRDAQSPPEIDYGHKGLRFQFALPSYDLSTKNQFQYLLEGFHDQWSAWSGESFVDFTNLPEGHYVFRVRGRDVYGQAGGEDRLAFTILPPWYRTWWALAFYALLLGGLAVMVVRFRERKLQMEKLVLENTVRERTEKITLQTEELKEMDRMKSRFFANISHEFRTPLTLILAPLEEELNKKPPAEQGKLLIMKRYANRLLELVNQLLNLSKLEAGKMELQVQKGDLRQFLSILSSSFDSLAQHKGIVFEKIMEIPEGVFWFDPDKLEKVIINLLSNAFKFTPSAGSVKFAAHVKEQAGQQILHISVIDTGKGIAPEEQKQVFESFYQSRQTVENQDGGTGLGLALAKELVRLHKGNISLQSEPGKGSVFSIQIPVNREAYGAGQVVERELAGYAMPSVETISPSLDLPESKQIEPENNDPAFQEPALRETVLIAEDNVELREYMASLLEDEYIVYKTPDGMEALACARKVLPSLIISDLMMPKMDGLELTASIKSDERTSHIPVILLTAKSGQESRIDGLKTGADDYLTKPFSVEELTVRVRNLIELRKKLAERYRERIRVHVTSSEEMSLDDKFLMKAKEIVEANMEDVLFSVEKMAEEMNLSRTQLLRKLKALTGLAPNDFIRDLRLQKAAEMIRQKADTITQIGYAVGFNDQSYFSKSFKKEFGETPTEYSARVSPKEV
ncbi:hybrid sensor histidine kinase/response regulator transcription factor [Dyadobacter sp. MSC1_007]|jgi:signal transduction histidine kinase/DNA-binding response OmpR family regulator|uniref:hybrid sensor histidine kinase/response regulator transcription factor n=1 Tax=Dyadobacter sp. MSC1_007 TaxID=2909264 RepID=UPI002030FB34|nr:ATP-binding protein [Dyadobacter sp. MSC1_007]